MSRDFILKTSRNNILRITSNGFENLSLSPCLILTHGFKGFKDWGFWNYTSEFFAKNGFFVLSFNFSHNGIGSSTDEFTELDKFADNTITLEISELSEIIEHYRNGFFSKSSNSRIGLIGHSRGGAVSILTAAKLNNVYSVAVWASVAKLDRYTDRQKQEWRKKGFIEAMNTRTNQMMRMNVSLLNDIETNKSDFLNIESAVKSLNCPFLIVHGEQDLTVPVLEAKKLYEWSNKKNSSLAIIPSTGHTFNVSHPFEGTNNKFEIVLDKTYKFFKNNLLREHNDD